MRKGFVIAAALFIGGLLAACSSDDDSGMGTGSGMGMDMNTSDDGHFDVAPVAEGARIVDVDASSFRFEPDEIRVRAGEDVGIRLRSSNGLHDFVVEDPEMHVVAADDEHGETGGLRIDDPGQYTFYCSVPGHRRAGMEGTISVER